MIADEIRKKCKYKVAYFKVNPDTGELEICLIPMDSQVRQVLGTEKTQLYTVPKDQKIIKLMSGDPWPFSVFPGSFWKADEHMDRIWFHGAGIELLEEPAD